MCENELPHNWPNKKCILINSTHCHKQLGLDKAVIVVKVLDRLVKCWHKNCHNIHQSCGQSTNDRDIRPLGTGTYNFLDIIIINDN